MDVAKKNRTINKIIILILISTNIYCYKRDRNLLTLNNWISILKIKKQDVLDNKIILQLTDGTMKINDAFVYIRTQIGYKTSDAKRINKKIFNSICDRLDLQDMKIE